MENSTAEDLRLPKEPPKPPETLTPEQARRDVSVLARALVLGYPGWLDLDENERGAARLGMQAIYDNDVGTTPEELWSALAAILEKIPDNHLNIKFDGKRSGSNKIPTDVGTNLAGENPFKVNLDKNGVATIAISRLYAFSENKEDEEKEIERFRSEAISAIDNSSAAIIDLRGNGGGWSLIINPIVERLYGAKVPIWKNDWWRGTLEAAIINNNCPIKGYEMKEEESDEDKLMHFPKDNEFPEFDAEKGYDKPVYMLLDGKVASSAEDMYIMLHKHPKLVTVGDNTSGTIKYGNVSDVVLPESGISLRVGTLSPEHFKDAEEGVGFAPDIRVPDGGDAYKAAMNHLANRTRTATVRKGGRE
jgi:hypothetical protein